MAKILGYRGGALGTTTVSNQGKCPSGYTYDSSHLTTTPSYIDCKPVSGSGKNVPVQCADGWSYDANSNVPCSREFADQQAYETWKASQGKGGDEPTGKADDGKLWGMPRWAVYTAGGAFVLGLIYMLSGSRKATPNRRLTAAQKASRKRKALQPGRAKRRHAARQDVKQCRYGPPAKHRRSGATQRSDYALPECWMYPIHDRKHVLAARRYFTRFKRTYPRDVQQAIERRIAARERLMGIAQRREKRAKRVMRKAA